MALVDKRQFSSSTDKHTITGADRPYHDTVLTAWLIQQPLVVFRPALPDPQSVGEASRWKRQISSNAWFWLVCAFRLSVKVVIWAVARIAALLQVLQTMPQATACSTRQPTSGAAPEQALPPYLLSASAPPAYPSVAAAPPIPWRSTRRRSPWTAGGRRCARPGSSRPP